MRAWTLSTPKPPWKLSPSSVYKPRQAKKTKKKVYVWRNPPDGRTKGRKPPGRKHTVSRERKRPESKGIKHGQDARHTETRNQVARRAMRRRLDLAGTGRDPLHRSGRLRQEDGRFGAG